MNAFGTFGETLARKFLEGRGYEFLEANFASPQGEIDLVMRDGEGVVFIEVKIRQAGSIMPGDDLPPSKLRKMQFAIDRYMGMKGEPEQWRCELVSIEILPNGLAKIATIPIEE